MRVGMGIATLRLLVEVLVIAAGIVASVSYEQVLDPCSPAFTQNVLNREDFDSQAEAQAAQRPWWRRVFGR